MAKASQRYRMATPFLCVATISIACASSVEARACSCLVETTLEETIEFSDLVFQGTVSEVVDEAESLCDDDDPGDRLLVLVNVDRVWKGQASKTVVLRTERSGSACGVDGLNEGDEAIFRANLDDEKPQINSCAGPLPIARASEVSDILGPASNPSSGEGDRLPPLCGGGCSNAGAPASLAVLLFAGLFKQRRRAPHRLR